MLKGWRNYLCLARLETAAAGQQSLLEENDLRLDPLEVKGLVNFASYGEFADHFQDQLLCEAKVHDYLGLDLLPNVGIKTGGATGGSTLLMGATTIASGMADCTLVLGWERMDEVKTWTGNYYIASAADQIYVNPGSLVGSIGVIMQGFGVEGLMQKLGVENRTLTAGEHKAILSPFSPMKPDEVAHVNRLLEEVHQQFIAAVKQGRGQRLKDDPQMFSGLFWTGQQAVELGLADGFGSVDSVARTVVQAEHVVDYSEHPDALGGLIRKLGTSMGDAVAARLSLPSTPSLR